VGFRVFELVKEWRQDQRWLRRLRFSMMILKLESIPLLPELFKFRFFFFLLLLRILSCSWFSLFMRFIC